MRYKLTGLDCASCVIKVENELRKVSGLENIAINFSTSSVELPEELVNEARAVLRLVEPEAELQTAAEAAADEHGEGEGLGKIIVAGLLFVLGLLVENFWQHNHAALYAALLLIPAYILVGFPVIRTAVRKIMSREFFDEHFLMTVATIGAIIIRQLPEAVGVMLFYAVGEYLEGRAVGRSRRSIAELIDIKPEFANLETEAGIQRISPEEAAVGATILVRPGEKIPLDGSVIEGESFVDTVALTGESVPRRATVDSAVLAGMINGEGLLRIRVEKTYSDSSVARILQLVEESAERKAPTERFITAFANIYTPIVVVAALLLALLPPLFIPGAELAAWTYRALVLLVISCPCAFLLSIPLGYFGGIGRAAHRGILVKGANYLDALAELQTLVLDKTGTLTKGTFRVSRIEPKNGFMAEELLAIAAAAELHSTHPIAASIKAAYQQEYDKEIAAEIGSYREIAGRGISATIDGRQVLAGNDRLMRDENIEPHGVQTSGSVVHIAIDGKYAGYLIVSDELRPEVGTLLSELGELGIKRSIILSGDREEAVREVAEELGVDEYYAELLPEDKVQFVEGLSAKKEKGKGKLGFLGDGINDAPVIMRADIGIAMGGLGSPAAIEAADVVLLEDSPVKLAEAVSISRATRRIIRQNIVLALAIKLLFVLLGGIGTVGIWEAVFADVGVTILAVLNVSRLTLVSTEKIS